MADPFSLFTAGASFAASATQFLARLAGVKDETCVIINQVKTITRDIVEAEALYLESRPYLADHEQIRIAKVIQETKIAANRVARLVEPARKDISKLGTVHLADRVDWILRKSSSTNNYQHSLNTCQNSLHSQIMRLRLAHTTTDAQQPPLCNERSSNERRYGSLSPALRPEENCELEESDWGDSSGAESDDNGRL